MALIDEEKLKKVLEHRRFVLQEFVESEREYVGRLQSLYEDYYTFIKQSSSSDVPSTLKADLLPIFSSLPEIFAFHKDVFLPEMEKTHWAEGDGSELMDCFLRHNADFGAYVTYCKNKPTSDNARVDYETFFSRRQSELGQKLSIEDLLITPVQRLPKYQLLIRDLLKDSKKANMETAKIEQALELMKKIPKEANDIICMSLIKGVSRANIISHGTLWIQDTLLFSMVNNGNGGLKEESKHVFLFDHLILVTHTADSDGFFDYLMGIKTLNGKVTPSDDDPLKFIYTRENGVVYTFKASSSQAREEWVNDIKAIHMSQDQMKKALIFGKSVTPKSLETVRSHSVTLNWSDSDSSIDSMPDSMSDDSDNEGDWPEQTGFHRIKSPLPGPAIQVSKDKPTKNKSKLKAVHSVMESRRMTAPEDTIRMLHPSNLSRPHSFHVSSVAEFDQTMQKKTNTLAISPRVLRRWVPRKSAGSKNVAHVYFPTLSTESNPMRSPGAQAKATTTHNGSSIAPDDIYYIAVEHQPPVAEQLYRAPPGQVFLPEDISNVDVWKVIAVSGENAGESVWVQRNTLEEYSASVSLLSLKKCFSVVNYLSSGRFSDVKMVRQKQSKKLQALKVFKDGCLEEQFYRELCIGSRISHQNLITYHRGLHHNRLMAISMDYINGRPLLDYLIRKSSFSEKMLADVMFQLFDALAYLHSHTILHLDVRPGNVLIHLTRESDVLKLIDYGAARHSGGSHDTLNLHFESSYKYEYVPPEVFQQVAAGPGTDIWAVGVILYLIFHGITPFVGGSTVRTIANITAVQYYFPTPRHPACSEQAKNLIKDIFTAYPNNRPTAESAMKCSWFTERASFMNNKIDLLQLQQYIRNCT